MSTELVREAQGVGLATQSHYVIKRKAFAFLERIFRVYTGDGQLIMYIQHPVMKLREEFMVYADEAKSQTLLKVKSRQACGFGTRLPKGTSKLKVMISSPV